MEAELASAHGSIKEIDESYNNFNKINRMKKRMRVMDDELKVFRENAGLEDDLVDTINKLDGEVTECQMEYEASQKLLQKSKSHVAKLKMQIEGYASMQQEYDCKIV